MSGLIDPADAGYEVTLSGTTVDFPHVTRGLYVGGIGDVVAVMAGGDTLTFVELSAGVVHPLRIRQIVVSGTTASDLIGVY